MSMINQRFDRNWESISNASEVLDYITAKMVSSHSVSRYDYTNNSGMKMTDLTFEIITHSLSAGPQLKLINVHDLHEVNATSLMEVVDQYLN